MLRLVALLFCVITITGPIVGLRAQEPSACDELTAEGAAPADVNAAVAACEAAVAAEPGEPRIVYQYALALERAGRIADALRMYEWAAADGHGPAVEAIARLNVAGAPDTEPGWTEAERTALSESMAGIAVAMRRFQNELPPDPSDPLTVIAEIGTDPAIITEWLATNTRLIPYAGSLRGARGVLSDRNGNSLDRALALAALLSAAGEDVRLARASLDEAQAEKLLTANRVAAVQVPDLQPPTPEEMLELFQSSGVPGDVAMAAIDQVVEQRSRAEAMVTEQTAILVPLLTRSTAAFEASATATLEQLARQQLQDHFWVQVQRGESWVDLDPDAEHIGSLTAAEVLALDQVPDLLRHAVAIRIVVEIQSPSGRREEILVSWTGFTASQSDMLVTLSHTSDVIDALAQLVSGGAGRERFLAAVDGTSEWTPLLWVDGQVHFDKFFTRDGQVRTVDPNILTQAGRGASSAVEEAGELLGNGAAPSMEVGVPTAQWIEIEVSAPGQPARIERRTLFDLLGPALRAGGAIAAPTADQLRDRALRLLGSSDILILGANPSRIELSRTATKAIAETADTIQALAQRPDGEIGDVREGRRVILPLRQFAQERLAGQDPPAISAPNVFMLHQRFVWGGADARGQAEVDIVFNDVVAPDAPFARRLQQGVADSVLEAAMIVGGASTAADTVQDIATGTQWTLLEPGDEERLGALAPDLRVQIESELAAGRRALVSLEPPSLGWWRIDPATGNVLAMSSVGGGATMAEFVLHTYQSATAGVCMGALATAIAGQSAARGAKYCAVMGATAAGGALVVYGATAAAVPGALLGIGLHAVGMLLKSVSP